MSKGHVLARICLSIGAVVLVISSILLTIVGADVRHTSAFGIAWIGFGIGVTLALCGVESLFSRLQPKRVVGRTFLRQAMAELGRAAVVATTVSLIMTLVGASFSPAASGIGQPVFSVLAGPVLAIAFFVYAAYRFIGQAWLAEKSAQASR